MKAHALPAAAAGIRALLRDDTPVVFAVNGLPWWYFEGAGADRPGREAADILDPGRILRDGIGPERTLGCVINSPNTVVAPGHIRSGWRDNRFIIGEIDGSSGDRLRSIVDVLSRSGTGAEATPTIRKEIWQKLLANVAGSTLGCLTHMNGAQMVADKAIWILFGRLSEETALVARAMGEDVGLDLDERRVRMGGSQHKASMLQDLEAGRAMEIDAQLASVLVVARAAGVPTPVADMLVPIVTARAAAAGLYAPAA